jgi:hypothetical protein
MRRALAIAVLMLTFGSFALTAHAGVTMGGKPYVPGSDLPVGGVTMGGRPFVSTGGVFTPTGFGLGAQLYDEGGDAALDPYGGFGGGADLGWTPFWSWFGWGAWDVLDILFGIPMAFFFAMW